MKLDLANNLVNNLKENKFVQNFMKELSNYLENNITNDSSLLRHNQWNNLLAEDLTICNKKIIRKYKDEMLVERNNILQNYAKNTKDRGEMYYIYNISENERNAYNICICDKNKSNEIITKRKGELPAEANLGSVLRKQNGKFILDTEATKIVGEKINNMIKEKIEEQNRYLDSKRIEGHIYEVGEKYSQRILLFDLNNDYKGGRLGIEEIDFPKDLYEEAKEGDLFIYKEGTYQKYIQ